MLMGYRVATCPALHVLNDQHGKPARPDFRRFLGLRMDLGSGRAPGQALGQEQPHSGPQGLCPVGSATFQSSGGGRKSPVPSSRPLATAGAPRGEAKVALDSVTGLCAEHCNHQQGGFP